MYPVERNQPDNAPAAQRKWLWALSEGPWPWTRPTFSGLDGTDICGEAADLNNDGLLDLVFAADPDNSGLVLSMGRYENKVYWNTGEHGAKENHWLCLRFSGATHAELIGARVELDTGGKKQYRWIHPDHSYKSGGALEAHFGLGGATIADLKITLPNGKSVSFAGAKADQYLDLNLKTTRTTQVKPCTPGTKRLTAASS